jgi:hypothetical protein
MPRDPKGGLIEELWLTLLVCRYGPEPGNCALRSGFRGRPTSRDPAALCRPSPT